MEGGQRRSEQGLRGGCPHDVTDWMRMPKPRRVRCAGRQGRGPPPATLWSSGLREGPGAPCGTAPGWRGACPHRKCGWHPGQTAARMTQGCGGGEGRRAEARRTRARLCRACYSLTNPKPHQGLGTAPRSTSGGSRCAVGGAAGPSPARATPPGAAAARPGPRARSGQYLYGAILVACSDWPRRARRHAPPPRPSRLEVEASLAGRELPAAGSGWPCRTAVPFWNVGRPPATASGLFGERVALCAPGAWPEPDSPFWERAARWQGRETKLTQT